MKIFCMIIGFIMIFDMSIYLNQKWTYYLLKIIYILIAGIFIIFPIYLEFYK